jgi:hypothetical protein
MARASKWNKEDRKKLLKMVGDGVPEQDIRGSLAIKGEPMSSVAFAQQLKMAMVEAGQIKQAGAKAKKAEPNKYEITKTGRLTLADFAEVTGFSSGDKFTLEKPRGRSKAWRIVPA